MTWEDFADVFALLALQLQATHADEAMGRAYHAALQDIEPELVKMAADRLGRHALNAQGEAWFPKAPEWRAMARKVEQDRADLQRAILRNLPGRLCLACDDTGWSRNPETNRVSRCDCVDLRRLEVLGRRPMPALMSRSWP